MYKLASLILRELRKTVMIGIQKAKEVSVAMRESLKVYWLIRYSTREIFRLLIYPMVFQRKEGRVVALSR